MPTAEDFRSELYKALHSAPRYLAILGIIFIGLPQTTRAQLTEQCSAPADSSECRSEAAVQIGAQFRTALPSIQVTAVGRAVVFADSVFNQQDKRDQFEKIVQDAGLAAALCAFGFNTVSVKFSQQAFSTYALSCSPAAAERPSLGTAKIEGNTTSEQTTVTFDQNSWSVPRQFQGDDPKTIADRLSNTTTKSEFETTAAFQQRKQATARALSNSLSSSGDFVFVMPPAAGDTQNGWEAKYDADAQKLRVIVRFSGFLEDGGRRLNTLDLSSDARSAGEHVASNAFGAVTEVSSSVGQVYGIALSPDQWLFERRIAEGHLRITSDNPFDFPTYRLNIPMTARDAIATKPNLSMLLVCKLIAPRVITDLGGHTATFSSPYESVIMRKYLPVEVKQVWVYEYSSGKVLQKRDASQPVGVRITASVPLSATSASFSGYSFLIDTDDIGIQKVNSEVANITEVVSAARSKARKKREQVEAEEFCKSGVRDIFGDVKTWFSNDMRVLPSSTFEFDRVPPAPYQLIVVGRSGTQIGVWSGTAVAPEDVVTRIEITKVVSCDDPNGEVNF
jgi:hypothetical protein